MKKLNIELKDNAYPVFIGENIFPLILKKINELKLPQNIFLITDDTIKKIYKNLILETFKGSVNRFEIFSFKTGEGSKNLQTIEKIHLKLLNDNFSRDTLIIAFGGGITGDIAGFAASTFMRGVKYIQVPTTLLACIDSSVGGKTGVNLDKYKNVIGSFYQPEFVLIDTAFLKSLPKKEVISGAGELLKYGLISDDTFYNDLKKNLEKVIALNDKILIKIIYESIKIKSAIVVQDEKESGLRKILNLGHTFAHAFENILEFKIKHGEAVAAGLINAISLSRELNLIDNNISIKLLQIFKEFSLNPKVIDINIDLLIDAMRKDKKNKNGKIKFVLPLEFGQTVLDVQVEKEVIKKSIKKSNEIIKQIISDK